MKTSSAQEDMLWDEVIRRGPMGLTRLDWSTVERDLTPMGRIALRSLLESLEDQSKWIVEAREKLVSEAAHIETLGIVMRKAGLRSYTDKEGRIYVATQPERPEQE